MHKIVSAFRVASVAAVRVVAAAPARADAGRDFGTRSARLGGTIAITGGNAGGKDRPRSCDANSATLLSGPSATSRSTSAIGEPPFGRDHPSPRPREERKHCVHILSHVA